MVGLRGTGGGKDSENVEEEGEVIVATPKKSKIKSVRSKVFYTTREHLAKSIACGCHFSLSNGNI